MFTLRFRPGEIPRWAEGYSYTAEDRGIDRLVAPIRARGYLTRAEFLRLCLWKSPRSQPLCARNTAARIRKWTATALASADDRDKIDSLRSLDGVGWPTASVILHFCDRRPYPILDYRALWSAGLDGPPRYTFALWSAYTDFTRRLARSHRVDMRTLDRALWQFAKAHQPG